MKDISDQKSNFVEKSGLLPYKRFLRKAGRSLQTWEDGNNWTASKMRFLLDDITENRHQLLE